MLLALLACAYVPLAAPHLLAATLSPEILIQVLFGDSSPAGADANGDGVVTVADLLVFGPPVLFDGTVAQFVPHGVDDTLVYRITDPKGAVTTETTIVTGVGAGGAFVLDDLQVEAQQIVLHQAQSYIDNGNQLLLTGFTDTTIFTTIASCSPPLVRVTTPLIVGQTSSSTTRCDVTTPDGTPIGHADRTDTFTPIDIVDAVTVPAGTFTHVVHISGTTNQSGQLETDEVYVAPGVGVIKQVATFTGQNYIHELISGTIGGHPVGP